MTGSSLPDALDLKSLTAAYTSGASTPSQLLQELYPRWAATRGMFVHLAPLQQLLRCAADLEAQSVDQRGSLWGIPFATKDNVDVAGMPTTAGCAAFQYMPDATALAVQALLDAGGLGSFRNTHWSAKQQRHPSPVHCTEAASWSPCPALVCICGVGKELQCAPIHYVCRPITRCHAVVMWFSFC